MEFFDVLRERGSILVEYTSESVPGVVLFKLLNYTFSQYGKNVGVIITDFLDTLAIYRYQAEFTGVPTFEPLKHSLVIKVGGKIPTGNVVTKIPISGYSVYKTLHENALSRVDTANKAFVINIQIGLENIMNLFDKRELIEQLHDIGEYIVTKQSDVRDILFLNVDAIRKVPIDVLPMLNVIVPIIARIEKPNVLKITKSILPDLENKMVNLEVTT
nr:DUF257 family protein [Thermococcus barophilus]